MLNTKIVGEVDHCRHRLMRFCRGQGVDLGCGASKIRTDAIGVDLYSPSADTKMDARVLDKFPSNHFDYVFSSHLLEEIENTEATLREWLRILKDGGRLVLYQADANTYFPLGDPRCNSSHKHHFTWETLWKILQDIGGTTLTHWANPRMDEWSFELVVTKQKYASPVLATENISILVPTLNRPLNIENFALSVNNTTLQYSGVEIVFGVQAEDIVSIQKIEELILQCAITLRHEIIQKPTTEKVNLSYLWNQVYAKAANPIVGFFGDDVIFHTPGWDEEVRKEFAADKTIMVYCNDVHVMRGRIATLFFTHKVVHDKFGFYLNEKFKRWHMDEYWDAVYRRAEKIHYREDILTEHLHPDAFPEKADVVYRNMYPAQNLDKILWESKEMQQEVDEKAKILKELKI